MRDKDTAAMIEAVVARGEQLRELAERRRAAKAPQAAQAQAVQVDPGGYGDRLRALHESVLNQPHREPENPELANWDFDDPAKTLALLEAARMLRSAVTAFGEPDAIAFAKNPMEARCLGRELGRVLEAISPALAATELNDLIRLNRRSNWARRCYIRARDGDVDDAQELAEWTRRLVGNSLEMLFDTFRRACGGMVVPVYRSTKWWGRELAKRLAGTAMKNLDRLETLADLMAQFQRLQADVGEDLWGIAPDIRRALRFRLETLARSAQGLADRVAKLPQ